jgi:hypothetical protein
MNGTHHLLAYADNINIFGENIGTIHTITEALLDANKKVVLEVNQGKTKYMLTSCCKKAGQKHSMKIVNRSFEGVTKFKYFGTTLRDQNFMHKEFKSRLN